MHPVVDVLTAERALTLGNFIFVVGKDVVHSPGVNVEPLAQILVGHGRAFNVPAGESFPPGAGPFHVSPRFSGFP